MWMYRGRRKFGDMHRELWQSVVGVSDQYMQAALRSSTRTQSRPIMIVNIALKFFLTHLIFKILEISHGNKLSNWS